MPVAIVRTFFSTLAMALDCLIWLWPSAQEIPGNGIQLFMQPVAKVLAYECQQLHTFRPNSSEHKQCTRRSGLKSVLQKMAAVAIAERLPVIDASEVTTRLSRGRLKNLMKLQSSEHPVKSFVRRTRPLGEHN